MSTEYAPISINTFLAANEAPSDVFIKLDSGKHIKVLKKGQAFDRERLGRYEGHEIKTLFLNSEAIRDYNQRGLEVCHALSARAGLAPVDRLKVISRIAEGVLAEVFYLNVSEDSMGCAESVIRQLVLATSELEHTDDLLKAVLVMNDDFAKHSVFTSLISIFLAKQMKWRGAKLLKSIATAGIFHDIGFKKLPGNLQLKNPDDLNPEELKIYHTHPKKSVEILSSYPEISQEALSAIADHHESSDGKGFPNGIAGTRAYPLSRLIFVANYISTRTLARDCYPNPQKIGPAIKDLLDLHGDSLREEYLIALDSIRHHLK